jgi:hypothetical protein
MPPAGRFPELANLPTMIAEGLPHGNDGMGFVDVATDLAPVGAPPAATSFANAPTALAPPIVPPAAIGFGNAPTAPAPSRVSPAAAGSSNAPMLAGNPSLPALAGTPIAPPGMGPPSYSSPPHGMPPPGVQVPPIQHPSTPQGYPVMNAQLSAQIATGATVFPSDSRGSQQYQAPVPQIASPSGGPRGPEPGSMPGGIADGYPQLPAQLSAQPRGPDGGSRQTFPRNGNPVDPTSAQVGPPHPEHVPWGAAAASRVRTVPPWLLAILFVGALGVALLITIAIAKIAR